MRHRIILDTDMGTDVDDALCLALAMASPEIELVAVTTVSGDAKLRARIAKRLLELGGHGDVPVHAGEGPPRSAAGAFYCHGREGEGILSPGDAPRVENEPAVDAIVRLLRASHGLEVVAVGPLTNVAAALDADPSLVSRVRRLTVMGGHIREIRHGRSVLAPGVDYNLCSDQEASLRVLRAGIPTRLVTGDVTLQTWLREEDLSVLATLDGALPQALLRAIRIWTPIQQNVFTSLGAPLSNTAAFLHDPLALACVADESFCRFEDLPIEPTVEGGIFRTLERNVPSPAAPVMRCATGVDAARFRAHFLERIARLAR
jgi:purine nucleosidase